MDGRTLFLILAGFAVVSVALIAAFSLGSRFGGAFDVERVRRPWWGHPGLWLVVAGLFVFLGLFVIPKLFGFAFLFVPLVWLGGSGWRRSGGGRPGQPHDEGS